ncbi:hypothetical protein [Mesorhizobium sp. M1409]
MGVPLFHRTTRRIP